MNVSKRKPGWWMDDFRILWGGLGLFWVALVALAAVNGLWMSAATMAALGLIWGAYFGTLDRRQKRWETAHTD